jgi:hypothetical protein
LREHGFRLVNEIDPLATIAQGQHGAEGNPMGMGGAERGQLGRFWLAIGDENEWEAKFVE